MYSRALEGPRLDQARALGRALAAPAAQARLAGELRLLPALRSALAGPAVTSDPALAAAVAFYILWSGWRLMKDSVGGLMDEAVPPETLAHIREIISTNADGAIEAHDLRTRHAGRMMFIDFHLVVPSSMSVAVAHDICDRLEPAIRAEFPDALISIHVEPDNQAKHSGIVVL